MFDFSQLLRPLASLKSRAAALRDEIQNLMAQRARVHLAPAARSDVKAMLARWVDRKSAGLSEALASAIGQFVRQPQMIRDEARTNRILSLVSPSTGPGVMLSAGDDEPASEQLDRALCGVMGPQIKEALLAAVDLMEWPDEGLPLTARDAEVKRLDEQINRLQTELDALERQAAEANITI
jgi:hypothetical protein